MNATIGTILLIGLTTVLAGSIIFFCLAFGDLNLNASLNVVYQGVP